LVQYKERPNPLKSPRQIMSDVMQNERVFNIWDEIVKSKDDLASKDCYYEIVKAQIEEVREKGYDAEAEGFQVGSPWHGHLNQGKIMFLSSNPGITPTCCYPRYHGNGKFTWYGNKTVNSYPANYEDPGICDLDGAINFLENRFQNPPLTASKSWSVYMLDGDNNVKVKQEGGVRFWNRMRKTHQDLLGKSPEEADDYFKKHVVSAEVVPFVSMGEKGVSRDLLEYCWKEYTHHVLANCPAQVIFLVGSKVRNLFCRIVGKPAVKDDFTNQQPRLVEIELAGQVRHVAFLRHFSTGWSESQHLPSKWFQPAVYQKLQSLL
jgi:hypothetical protein